MKRTLLLIVISLIAMVTRSEEAVNIVFIGNSITYGACLSSPATTAPPVKTVQMVAEKTGRRVRYKNCGWSGSTTLNWLPGTSLYNSALGGAETFCTKGGCLIFNIMLGTNDSAESGPTGSPVSPEDYITNLRTIIQSLMDKYPHAGFIVNYPLWYSPNTHNGAVYKEKGLARLQTYYPQITQMVADFQTAGQHVWAGNIDVYTAFEDQNSLFVAENGNSGVFYLHPNLDGGTKLAEFWSASIIEHLADCSAVPGVNNAPIDYDENSGKYYTYDSNDGLLVNASQLYANSEMSGFPVANLLNETDDYTNIIFHSVWGNGALAAGVKNYIQCQIPEGVDRIFFTMVGSNWNSTYDTPDDIEILATNTPDDDESWVNITSIPDLIPASKHSDHPAFYNSPQIPLGQAYTHLRFVVNKTVNNRSNGNGNIYLSLARFQIFKAYEADAVTVRKYLVNEALTKGQKLFAEITGLNTVPLLTNASQLYANSEMSGFPVSNLLDPGTVYDKVIFHSVWGTGALPAGVYNYLQVKLPHEVDHMAFSMIGSSWNSTYDTPDHIEIQATNTPDDESTWTRVAEIEDAIPLTEHDVYPARYTSPNILLGNSYTNLRFIVLSTVNNRSNGNGNIFFSLARFQVYGDADASTVYAGRVPGMQAAADELKRMLDLVLPQNPAEVSDSDLASLQAAVDAVVNLYPIEYSRTVKSGSFEPLCLDRAICNANATLYSVYGRNGNLLFLNEVDSEEVVPGQPYLLLCNGTKLEVLANGQPQAEPGQHNGLVGVYSSIKIKPSSGDYMVSGTQVVEPTSTRTLSANRAYIHMADVQEVSDTTATSLTINGTTGILSTEVENQHSNIYTLSGQRSSVPQYGVYIIDGTKKLKK